MNLSVELFTFIVSVDDGPKALLASSIPDLQLHYAIVNIEGLESEINSDGNHVVFIEIVVGEPQEE